MPFADAVVSSAVLHFAADDEQFGGYAPRHVAGSEIRSWHYPVFED
ncbi:MAG TPA: hypothetical protein VGY48_04380 [Vicinamibacterales bacterium]|nr:hypothetical protein [Vicinamibacterales bacterium]